MDASSSCCSEYDEGNPLKGLCDAFGSAFSLEEINSAFVKAGCNANMAGEVLYGLQQHDRNGVSHISEGECSSFKSKELFLEDSPAKTNHKVSKPKKVCFSTGTVSSMMGRRRSRPTSSLNDSCKATNSLSKDEPQRDRIVPDTTQRNMPVNNNDIEKFLFEMLGDGFQLDMDTIREVFG